MDGFTVFTDIEGKPPDSPVLGNRSKTVLIMIHNLVIILRPEKSNTSSLKTHS